MDENRRCGGLGCVTCHQPVSRDARAVHVEANAPRVPRESIGLVARLGGGGASTVYDVFMNSSGECQGKRLSGRLLIPRRLGEPWAQGVDESALCQNQAIRC